MSYYAYDSGGYIGDLASINGLSLFSKWAQNKGVELTKFLDQGYSDNLDQLKRELNKLRTTGSNESVRANLAELAGKAKDVLIIHDGEDATTEESGQ